MFWKNKITCDKTFRIIIYIKLRSIFFHSYYKLKTQFILLLTLSLYLYLEEKTNSNSSNRLCNGTWLSPLISWVQVAEKSGWVAYSLPFSTSSTNLLAQPFQSWGLPCSLTAYFFTKSHIAECIKSFIWISIIQRNKTRTISLTKPILLFLLLTASLPPCNTVVPVVKVIISTVFVLLTASLTPSGLFLLFSNIVSLVVNSLPGPSNYVDPVVNSFSGTSSPDSLPDLSNTVTPVFNSLPPPPSPVTPAGNILIGPWKTVVPAVKVPCPSVAPVVNSLSATPPPPPLPALFFLLLTLSMALQHCCSCC